MSVGVLLAVKEIQGFFNMDMDIFNMDMDFFIMDFMSLFIMDLFIISII